MALLPIRPWLWTLPALLTLAGCHKHAATSPLTYQFTRTGPQEVLTPPGAKAGIEIDLAFPKARMARKRGCDVDARSFALRWQGRKALLRVNTEDMQDADRVPVNLLDDITRFRAALSSLHKRGCIRRVESGQLLERIAESLAIPSGMAFALRHGSIGTGYFDIQPPFRLKVVVPRRVHGELAGYETAYYAMKARSGGEKLKLEPESVELQIDGRLRKATKPEKAVVDIPPGATYFRMFFLTRRSVRDHDILLLSAATQDDIERVTATIQAEGQDACRRFKGATVECLEVPLDSAVSAELVVTANGQPVYVPVSGTIRDAIRSSGVRDPARVSSIAVMRPYGGRMIPVTYDAAKPDILSLVLIGGEQLSWETGK